MTLGVAAYVEAVRSESKALSTAGTKRLDGEVRACPGWTVADLIHHVGEVHDFWAGVVADLRTGVDRPLAQPRPADDELIDWFDQGAERLCSILGDADPAAPCWTWAAQKNVAFVQRRMAQETAVHRWDGEDAAGTASPIDRELAVDGIDEFADIMLNARLDDGAAGPYTVHLHCTDGEGEWLFASDGTSFTVTRGHIKGDAALRGAASDLLLALWRRLPVERLDVVGPVDVARRLVAGSSLE